MSDAATAGTRELDRAPDPGSSVPCPLKGGQQIAPGRCVEWQRDNGCHCEYALVSLRRVEKILSERVAGAEANDPADQDRVERLDEVRALTKRAEQVERQRPKPPPPEHDDKRADEIAARLMQARRFDPRGLPEGGLRRQVSHQEQTMGVSYSEGRHCNRGGCKNPVANTSKKGTCTPCLQGYAPGSEASIAKAPKTAAATGQAAKPAAPAKAAAPAARNWGTQPTKPIAKPAEPRPPPSAPAIPEDIVSMLQRQRDHYAAQLARIDKALAALRD